MCFLEPTVHSVFSPTYDSTWYQGGTYAIQWYSTNVTNVDVLLLFINSLGNVSVYTTIAASTVNSGLFMWTIPSTIFSLSNGYFITVRPTGVVLSLDGYSRSPPFSITAAPSGPCPAGTISSTGSYPSCTACPQGSFSVRFLSPILCHECRYSMFI